MLTPTGGTAYLASADLTRGWGQSKARTREAGIPFVRAAVPVRAEDKIERRLAFGQAPAWAREDENRVDVTVRYFQDEDPAAVAYALRAKGFTLLRSSDLFRRVTVRMPTSFSAPAVSGVLALLTQRYKAANGDQNPKPALLRAVLFNTANDLGNPGPDYTYGYGSPNALEALRTLEDRRFTEDKLEPAATKTHKFTIEGGRRALKVKAPNRSKSALPPIATRSTGPLRSTSEANP